MYVCFSFECWLARAYSAHVCFECVCGCWSEFADAFWHALDRGNLLWVSEWAHMGECVCMFGKRTVIQTGVWNVHHKNNTTSETTKINSSKNLRGNKSVNSRWMFFFCSLLYIEIATIASYKHNKPILNTPSAALPSSSIAPPGSTLNHLKCWVRPIKAPLHNRNSTHA